MIYGVDNNSSLGVDNRKTHILILDKDPADELGDTAITAEAIFYQFYGNNKEMLS